MSFLTALETQLSSGHMSWRRDQCSASKGLGKSRGLAGTDLIKQRKIHTDCVGTDMGQQLGEPWEDTYAKAPTSKGKAAYSQFPASATYMDWRK